MLSLGQFAILLSLLVAKQVTGYKICFQRSYCLGNRSPLPVSATDADSTCNEPTMRIGYGYDIHRLINKSGSKLIIGGVVVPHDKGADAHSDGDAVYHSIVDAILGALCMPDIGQQFPDDDPQWKGADSSIFIREVYKMMTRRGYRIGNVDVTLVLQAPKVRDLKPLMRANIARLLHSPEDRVNVKARTHEEVDSVGEGRAYECHVVVLLEKL